MLNVVSKATPKAIASKCFLGKFCKTILICLTTMNRDNNLYSLFRLIILFDYEYN